MKYANFIMTEKGKRNKTFSEMKLIFIVSADTRNRGSRSDHVNNFTVTGSLNYYKKKREIE